MLLSPSNIPSIAFLIILSCSINVFGLERRAPSRNVLTSNVLKLTSAPWHFPISPNSLSKRFSHSQFIDTIAHDEAEVNNQQDLLTLGGRVYMTNVTLGNQSYTLVIDTGSSDTWIAGSNLQCLRRITQFPAPNSRCGFRQLYHESLTFERIESHDFTVSYTDEEFLSGDLGTEEVEVAGLKARSSGLMGLAYPSLVSNVRDLNYTSIIFSLFEDKTIPPIFSLALTRSTNSKQYDGGLLALGGIP
ncbi:acid protease [Zopfia rhizophila CBS 207.26]|uniref:Acid protease n=1 Tax=Zopfia rhizophila CBS 207.26 TaxID=1314779 RepID=A0A6A6ETF7_9PEZI|nr:acid protease [Zopfia rhizophila CBS 207.26]